MVSGECHNAPSPPNSDEFSLSPHKMSGGGTTSYSQCHLLSARLGRDIQVCHPADPRGLINGEVGLGCRHVLQKATVKETATHSSSVETNVLKEAWLHETAVVHNI